MEILNPILANNWLDPPGLANKALSRTLFSKGFIIGRRYISSQINTTGHNIIWNMTNTPRSPHTLIGNFPPNSLVRGGLTVIDSFPPVARVPKFMVYFNSFVLL